MRLGLIARDEVARGLAIQSKNAYDHLPFDDVLLVRSPRPVCDLGGDWYPGATVVTYINSPQMALPDEAFDWARQQDVIFCVETPHDWTMPGRVGKAKIVVQGNPEFYVHDQKGQESRVQPSEWWWPTTWRQKSLPTGRLMPVPMPDRHNTSASVDEPILRVLHVVGKRAHADRNGTEIVSQMVRFITQRMHLTIYGLDGQLPDIPRNPLVTVETYPDGVDDRWAMYEGQHILALPRRYGGLCLPALEARACGLIVLMPATSPNQELATLQIEPVVNVPLRLPCGEVLTAKTRPQLWARVLDNLAADRKSLAALRAKAPKGLPLWSEWRQKYMDAFDEVAG